MCVCRLFMRACACWRYEWEALHWEGIHGEAYARADYAAVINDAPIPRYSP